MILVDGNGFTDYYNDENELVDYKCVIGGDNEYFNIACAIILAKEYHDKVIRHYIEEQPELDERYSRASVCYGTQNHHGIENGVIKISEKLWNMQRIAGNLLKAVGSKN